MYSFHFNLLNVIVLTSFFMMGVKLFELGLLVVLFFIMAMVFVSNSLLFLYVFFELSLVPIFLIIYFKGKQYERKSAALYLLFFTLFSSLPLLVMIISLQNSVISFLIQFRESHLSFSWMMVFFLLAFLVKLPVYFFHMWLPKAHVEAPIYGSMVLAGVMLKLGGWGLYKILGTTWWMFKNLSTWLSSFLFLGLLISSFYCLVLSDLKIIIAVSSVSHMGLSYLSPSPMFIK